ncbi:hypothetical protein [Nonomuraea sp. NPDC049504]|uniref:hypothetical protein n=1 Tax=Nonomuraea sp. NPDC049504 TaxID=3154729 RepID=UPI0034483DE0
MRTCDPVARDDRKFSCADPLLVSHEGEEIRLTAQQADAWTRGAFAVCLALVDQRRISPRIPGATPHH